jgi:hypothetical protein
MTNLADRLDRRLLFFAEVQLSFAPHFRQFSIKLRICGKKIQGWRICPKYQRLEVLVFCVTRISRHRRLGGQKWMDIRQEEVGGGEARRPIFRQDKL